MRMRIGLVAKPGHPNTGVGRYVQILEGGLRHAGADTLRVAPLVPPLPSTAYAALRRAGMDLRAFLTNYPVWADYPEADVYHFTSQNLASLLLFRRPPGNVVVTVHDIIPYMLRDNPRLSSYRTVADRLFDRLAMAGLERADRLLADSHYTKSCLVEYLETPPEKIEVVYLGIDHEHFRPLAVPGTVHERFRLPVGRRYLIYVGSEDPRKNLGTLVRALAEVRRDVPNVELIKVGRAHFDRQRQMLIRLAHELGVRAAVHFLDDVAEEDLPLLYNLADVCVMPSTYEGFGFPALEAMACGTPVVCANAASLPELVGDAALTFEHGPDSVKGLAMAIRRVLSEPDLAATLRTRGQARAATFRWSECVRRVLDVFRNNAPVYGHVPVQG